MMVLYSGTTDPFSHRCRFVLFEKGMDFEIRDVDMFNIPAEVRAMTPYGTVPVLNERDLILYEANVIDEYIDERFPHPQLMPPDPITRARTRMFIYGFERELYQPVRVLEITLLRKKRGKLPASRFRLSCSSSPVTSRRTSISSAKISRCSISASLRSSGVSTTTRSSSRRPRRRSRSMLNGSSRVRRSWNR